MELDDLIKDINCLFIDLFKDKTIVLNEYTTSEDIGAWDSLNHIQVITAVESRYQICFELNELLNFNNIGDLCRCVQSKLNQTLA